MRVESKRKEEKEGKGLERVSTVVSCFYPRVVFLERATAKTFRGCGITLKMVLVNSRKKVRKMFNFVLKIIQAELQEVHSFFVITSEFHVTYEPFCRRER